MMSWMRAVSVLFLGTPLIALAQHDAHQHAAAKDAALKQTTCPVSGKPVTPDAATDYEGHKVLFCSKACVSKFQDKPETYLPALYAQWYPQAVQVKCPVMDGDVDGKTFVEFKGQQVAFCCDGCNGKFTAAPAKYLAKLDKLSTTQVHCPVTGQAIDPKITTKYQGKPVYFSSQDALAKFQADPAKYAEKLLPEQGIVARGATADDDLVSCPICAERGGAAHQRKQVQSVVLNGKVYFTCSSSCESKLKADPAKYDAILQKQTKQAATANAWYTCPMHADVFQKGPGKCPKCSMALEPLKDGPDTSKKSTSADHGGHMGMGASGMMNNAGHQMEAGGHGGHQH